jgi:hypothetical protein
MPRKRWSVEMKSWKTTLAGMLSAGGYAALTAMQNGTLEPRDLAIIAGLAAVGVLAKDLNVTGAGK